MPFIKGKSGNPAGRAKLPPDLLTQLRAHKSKFKLLVLEYAGLKRSELDLIAKDEDRPWVERTLAKHMHEAQVSGSSPVGILQAALGTLPDGDLKDNLSDDERELIELYRKECANGQKPSLPEPE